RMRYGLWRVPQTSTAGFSTTVFVQNCCGTHLNASAILIACGWVSNGSPTWRALFLLSKRICSMEIYPFLRRAQIREHSLPARGQSLLNFFRNLVFIKRKGV